ncbi:hypothetical protein CL630_00440 [bacterium]|nr:hypothetical protein [bacterium]|tara:strand:- start:27035 stop:27511 length:477 start_codon:yes stop_codon:yes gene_type:complete
MTEESGIGQNEDGEDFLLFKFRASVGEELEEAIVDLAVLVTFYMYADLEDDVYELELHVKYSPKSKRANSQDEEIRYRNRLIGPEFRIRYPFDNCEAILEWVNGSFQLCIFDSLLREHLSSDISSQQKTLLIASLYEQLKDIATKIESLSPARSKHLE